MKVAASKSWVVLILRSTTFTETTIDLPGIGEVVAFGNDKRDIAFETHAQAMDAAMEAEKDYSGVYEVVRLVPEFGVCDED